MTRIAILHYAAPPIVGGVESTIHHHARLLAEMGNPVHVIAGRGSQFLPGVEFCHLPEVDSRSKEVLKVGKELANGQVTDHFYSFRDRLTDRLRSLFSNIDVCIVHNAVTLHKNLPLTASLHQIAEDGAPRLIAWCHDFAWADALYTPDLHAGYPWDLLRNPWPGVKYVAVSDARRSLLAGLIGLPESQIHVVEPGVDVAGFLKLEPITQGLVNRLDLYAADPLLLLPVRITRRKNIEFAIEVLAVLSQTRPMARLLVTGPPGPHNPKNIAYLNFLEEMRDRLGVSDRVVFLYKLGQGKEPLHLSDAVIADLYQLADALLFPSRREGFGMPVIEAGLARLPIFAADIPPIRNSLGDSGVRFDPLGDPGVVAQAILEYLDQDQAHRLRRRILRWYDWRRVVERDVIPLVEEQGVN